MGYNTLSVRITDQWLADRPCAGGCGRNADYGVSDGRIPDSWTTLRKGRPEDLVGKLNDHFTGWCSTCRPHRGRRPLGRAGLTVHAEADLDVQRWLDEHACTVCGRPAETAMTGPGEPKLAQLRVGEHRHERGEILSCAVAYCENCLRQVTGAMGRRASTASMVQARELTPERLRAAILGAPGTPEGPAHSENMVMRRLAYLAHGNSRNIVRRAVAAARQADPTFPDLPNALRDLPDPTQR